MTIENITDDLAQVLPKLISEIKSNSRLATRKSGVELARPPKVPIPKGIEQDWLWDVSRSCRDE